MRSIILALIVGLLSGTLTSCFRPTSTSPSHRPNAIQSEQVVTVPKIWDENELATWAVPVAGLGVPPSFLSEKEYYALPVDNLRTYPVYHPDYEPAGYRDWLKKQGPQPLITPARLKTESDWIEAGKRVFEELDIAKTRTDDPLVLNHFSDAAAIDFYRDEHGDVLDQNGVILTYRWVVDTDNKLKISLSSCASCHTQLMPDGSLLPGAPANYDLSFSPAADFLFAKLKKSTVSDGDDFYVQFGVPWREDDIHVRFKNMSDEDIKAFRTQESGGVIGSYIARFNGSPFFTTRMGDLMGVKDHRYLEVTATHLNRGPADIARYCTLVEFADIGAFGSHHMADPKGVLHVRPPDEAMYAMALYIYSLKPPPSPYPFNAKARRGKRVFESEGCMECHTPPAYTNNKLVAVPGFEPPMDVLQSQQMDISTRRVGTDPGLALRTRKGTGFYRVPSLRGLWYRISYEHSGSIGSLEDWFDPRRMREDYVPSGWRGPGVKARAVPGHPFGHDLSDEDKAALIAFLRTL